MGIKIDSITIKNLGPIQDFSEDFGLFNIIFSKNECGKTFLTEFVIRSLFKNIKRWNFREKGVGKVVISGLAGPGNLDFSPDTVKKLEDYWEMDERGMPLSMASLLVSKGGEASIENTEEGISKGLIREIFSGISLLDRIDSDANISKTVKAAEMDRNDIDNIIISRAGAGRDYRQLREELNRIDNLFEEIESKYSVGIIESYRAEKDRLEDVLQNLHKAKQHEAYTISEKIENLNKKLQQNDEELLNELSGDVSIYESKEEEYRSKAEQAEKLREEARNFDWLKKASLVYERLAPVSVKRPHIAVAVLSGMLLIAAILFSILGITLGTVPKEVIAAGTIVSVIVSAGLGAFYIIRLLRSSKNTGLGNELDKIKKEFKTRTGKELTDIATLSAEIDRQRESYDRSVLLSEQLEGLKTDIQNLGFSIQQKFYELAGDKIPRSMWLPTLKDKKAENHKIREKIDSLRRQQSELGVREVDYLPEDPGVTFSYAEFEKIQADLDNIQVQINDKEAELVNLKYRIYTETEDDPSIEWGSLLENLREKRIGKQKEFDEYEAGILAGILVHQEITRLREEEDNKILEGLRSDVVLKPLLDLTDNYKNLTLDGEKLLISDEYRDFCFSDLSTGIREQIMLALRIGFSHRILKQETLFLILDDAFQHSDWDRREILVKKLAKIAKSGWQIIYLSMDDHIKKLFEKEGARFAEEDFRSIVL